MSKYKAHEGHRVYDYWRAQGKAPKVAHVATERYIAAQKKVK